MKNYLFFGLIFFVMTNGYAQVQSDYTYFDFNNLSLPESPIANNLLKFEEIPVDVATGIPQINIPLFSFEIDGLIIPISLSYHAAGIKVNDFSSAVGLNWTLNAGGGIYRKVNSLPDEEGWTIANKGPLPQSFYEGKNIRSHNYRILMSGGPQADGTSGYAALRDHNPDDFSYSIMNKSGKFILDFEGDIIKNQADEFEIDLNGFNFPVFKDQKGNKFFFGDNKEYGFRRFSGITQIEKENDSIIFPIIENSNQYENGHPTAWMLSKIETKNNKKIFFEYEDYSVSENRNILKLSHSITTGMECYYGKQTPVSFASSHTLLLMNPLSYEPEYKMQLLSAIKSESFDIYFYYSLDDNLSEWQKKLDKIEIKDNFKNEIKEIHFEYGIYNGDSRLRLDRIYEKKENKELPGYYFNYNNGALPSRYSLAQDFFGYYNGQNQNNSLAPRNDWTFNRFQYKYASFYNNKTGIRTHNGNYLKTGIIKEIIYPTGGKTKFDFEPNSEFRNGIEKYTGGLRIRKIEDIDNTNEVVNTRKYQYQNLIGISYETDFFSTISEVYGNRTSITYHSDFVKHKSTLNSGYHYGKVAEIVINKYDNYKKEYLFKSNYSYGILNNLLESEIYFKNNDTLKLIEYNYRVFGDLKEINWNILGERECVVEENSNQSFITYRKGQNMIASGNIVKLPTQIITTDYLGPI